MKKILFCIFIMSVFSSCVEEIPFKTDSGDNLLIVSGSFTNSDEPQEVVLQKTAAYGTAPKPVLGAGVIVKNAKGEIGRYQEKSDGKYVLQPKILRGVVGESYHLEVEINGQTYESEAETMAAVIQPDSIFWEFGRESVATNAGLTRSFDVVNVFVSTPLKSENKDAYLRWQMADAFQFTTLPECDPFRFTETCYFSKQMNPQVIQVASSKEFRVARTNKLRVGFESIEPAYTFLARHYFTLFQYSISEKANDYWQKVNTLANQNGSIFDAIPASVKGNVSNKNNKNEKVLGYFEVSSVAIKRVYTVAVDIKKGFPLLPQENYCDGLRSYRNRRLIDGCCHCLELPYPNGTKIKPVWW